MQKSPGNVARAFLSSQLLTEHSIWEHGYDLRENNEMRSRSHWHLGHFFIHRLYTFLPLLWPCPDWARFHRYHFYLLKEYCLHAQPFVLVDHIASSLWCVTQVAWSLGGHNWVLSKPEAISQKENHYSPRMHGFAPKSKGSALWFTERGQLEVLYSTSLFSVSRKAPSDMLGHVVLVT